MGHNAVGSRGLVTVRDMIRRSPMALNSPADLFVYELSATYDAERKSNQLLGEVVGQVRDGNVAQILSNQQQEGQQKIRNLEACFQTLGTAPQEIACAAVDGMRADFQAFLNHQPVREVFEMYALGAATKLAHFGLASYNGLVDKATLMGESECAQILLTNLVQKQESVGRLERVGHEMGQRVLAAA
jgi:ferritin-like metal-binding protein YciE